MSSAIPSANVRRYDDTCPICFETTSSEVEQREITELKCFHVFHSNCVQESLKIKSSCPTCRAPGFLDGHIEANPIDTISSLLDKIATTYNFVRPRLRLLFNNRSIATCSWNAQTSSFSEITLHAAGFKSGDKIWAIEARQVPHHRGFPSRSITLILS